MISGQEKEPRREGQLPKRYLVKLDANRAGTHVLTGLRRRTFFSEEEEGTAIDLTEAKTVLSKTV